MAASGSSRAGTWRRPRSRATGATTSSATRGAVRGLHADSPPLQERQHSRPGGAPAPWPTGPRREQGHP
eukprot:2693462-Pyramimonas_sp.AAC.1